MKKYIPILRGMQLFAGIKEDEIESMLSCLQARSEHYIKGEYVLRCGQPHNSISVLVEGQLHIQHDDYWGNRSIISTVDIGDMFGEAYATGSEALLNDVVAIEDSTVIHLDVNRVLTVCSNSCRFHSMPYPKKTDALLASLGICQSEAREKSFFHICLSKLRSKTAPALSFLSTASS